MRTARKAAGKRAIRKLAPLTVVDWRKYCYDTKYEDILKNDYSNETARVRMAKLGYMQLTLCKMLTDQFGNDVANRLQFKRLDAPSSEILYFQTWKEVKGFCKSEEFARKSRTGATTGQSVRADSARPAILEIGYKNSERKQRNYELQG